MTIQTDTDVNTGFTEATGDAQERFELDGTPSAGPRALSKKDYGVLLRTMQAPSIQTHRPTKGGPGLEV